jgi:type IV pilus assembly protein PilC
MIRMKFHYKAQNKDHQIIEGEGSAPDKFILARELREKGDIPFSIQEINADEDKPTRSSDLFHSVSLSEKIIFTKNLSGMLQAGLSLVRSLLVLEKQSKNPTFKNILHTLVDEVNKGNTLSDGMKKFPAVFSKVFVSIVRSGEESGGLPDALSGMGVDLKKSYDLNARIKGAMMYPSIIVGAMIIIGILMMIYVVPTLTNVFKGLGAKLPASTEAIIWVSDAVSTHTLEFIIILMAIGISGILFSRLKIVQQYFDFIVLRLPVIGALIKETNSARTARTLSTLLGAGVDMSKALMVTEEVMQNYYYKRIIRQAIESVEKGVALSQSFKNNTDLYPIMVGEMMEVGEETGKLSSMLLDIASFYESEVDEKTKDLSTIVEPILMVFIGGAVGFFAISMITPIYSVMSSIK